LFILSLAFLPPARRPWELALIVLASCSTAVVFAVERSNPDIVIFILALLVGVLAVGRQSTRVFAYAVALVAAVIKYYPIALLILMFRERVAAFFTIGLVVVALMVAFLAIYLPEIERGLPLAPSGSYHTDMFGAKNLPFQIAGFLYGHIGDNSPTSSSFDIVARGLFVLFVAVSGAFCWRLLARTTLYSTLAGMNNLEGVFLVIGCALIVGCFFAAQNIAYRCIFLLFILPGLFAIARKTADPVLRRIAKKMAVAVVFVMWGEFFRMGLINSLNIATPIGYLVNLIDLAFWMLWLAKELIWWWMVSIMMAVLLGFSLNSKIFHYIWQGRANAKRDGTPAGAC
jgi:hypothetical protein